MQETRKQLLTDRFAELVEQLNQCMHRRPLDEWEGLDLTIPQFKTLALLQNQGSQRMGSISAYLGSTFSSSTSIIDRLVDKDLVERVLDPDDRGIGPAT
jgi:DNA-binding MarR family transcriptional regulator